MGKKYNNLISTTAGFNYAAQQPLDDREVVQSYEDLSTLITSNLSYDGMRVYVVDEKTSYILTNNEWVAVATKDDMIVSAEPLHETGHDIPVTIKEDKTAFTRLPIYNGANEGGATPSVIANPTLYGTEDNLTSLEVDGVAYKVPKGNYVLEISGESGTLTDEQYQAVTDNFPNVVVKLDMGGVIAVAFNPYFYNAETGYSFLNTQADGVSNYVITQTIQISTNKEWAMSVSEVAISESGVPQYNLSTVLKVREEVTLDATDTMALFSILSDMNNLLKFQNIGVVIYNEEAEGHQPFIGLDIKPDYVGNVAIFSYQGVFYNIDLIADPVAQVIKGRVMSKSQVGGSNVLTVEISQTGASGYLDVDLVGLIAEKFPNVNIRVLGKYIYTPLEFDATTNHYKFANVSTSDTQAETKLITVNANTNEWTATQYLANLGGSGGITKQKVTLAELQEFLVDENAGTLVSIVCKAKPPVEDNTVGFLLLGLAQDGLSSVNAIISPSIDDFKETCVGFSVPLFTIIGKVNLTGCIKSSSVAMRVFVDGEESLTDISTFLTDENFDFYIYK